MRYFRGIVVGLCVSLALCISAVAQNLRVQNEDGSAIERLPNGQWRVSYLVGETRKEITLETATGIVSEVGTEVSLDRGQNLYSYRYRISNGPLAAQAVHSASFSMMYPVQVADGPGGWRAIETPSTSRLSWFRVPSGPRLDGVLPGETATGFQVFSPNVPAPTEVRVKGNTPPLELPTDLPPAVMERLDRMLVLRNYLMVWAITPSIPAASNEPEATVATLTSRVLGAYHRALDRSRHPRKVEILTGLSQAVRLLEADEPAGRAALEKVKSMASEAGNDRWAKELGAALILALDHASLRER